MGTASHFLSVGMWEDLLRCVDRVYPGKGIAVGQRWRDGIKVFPPAVADRAMKRLTNLSERRFFNEYQSLKKVGGENLTLGRGGALIIPWPGRRRAAVQLRELPPMQTPHAEQSLSILAEAPFGVATVDAEGRLSWCNPALAELAGRSLVGLAGLPETELLVTDEISSAGIVQFEHGGKSALRVVMDLDDGQRVVYYQDVTAQEALRSERNALDEQLQQHNTIDPVSGLLNQQAVGRGLEPLVSRSRRYDNPLSVVTLSLANLQAVRSEHGDAAADEAVLSVSQLLRDQIRWADLVGRLDNGDFIFVLPETDQPAAEALAGKIARQLSEFTIPVLGNLRPEGCFGVSSWHRGDDANLLIKRANEALGEAVQSRCGLNET